MSLSGKPLRDLEEAFLTSVKDGTWPGAVVAAVNWSGSFYYANTFGKDACGSEGTPLMLVRDTATGLLVLLERPFLTEGVTECFGDKASIPQWKII